MDNFPRRAIAFFWASRAQLPESERSEIQKWELCQPLSPYTMAMKFLVAYARIYTDVRPCFHFCKLGSAKFRKRIAHTWMCETRVRVALKLFFNGALIDVPAVLSDGIRARARSKDLMAVSCCTHTQYIYIYYIHIHTYIIYTDTECRGLMHVYHASTSQQCFVPAHFRVQKSYANIAAGLFPRQLHVHQWYWNYSTCNCCILPHLELRLSFWVVNRYPFSGFIHVDPILSVTFRWINR